MLVTSSSVGQVFLTATDILGGQLLRARSLVYNSVVGAGSITGQNDGLILQPTAGEEISAFGAVSIQKNYSEIISLSTFNWTLHSSALNGSNSDGIPARFPSYAHLDLEAHRVVRNPEFGLNDFHLRWIWKNNWTYKAPLAGVFGQAAVPPETRTYLLFGGLDTFTAINLCEQHVANTDNQFRQYWFDVTEILQKCSQDSDDDAAGMAPELTLNFGSAPNIAEEIAHRPGQQTWPWGTQAVFEIPFRQFIRKQGNDFGWDWGPAYAPAGPWKPGYLVRLGPEDVHPRNVLVDVFKPGQRSNIIPDLSQRDWVVNASIDVIGTLPEKATLDYRLTDAKDDLVASGSLTSITQVNNAISGVTAIPGDLVKLWWPVGMGNQELYNLEISIIRPDSEVKTTVTRRIGFRTIVLNQQPVTDEEIATGLAPGNHWHFEINGYPFFSKGSNFIPPNVFWPRVTKESIRGLFNSVMAGNQNMLRVWSTGAYSPDFMYDLADEMGILLWSEFEFGDCLYPATSEFLSSVYEEAVYHVRRVNHHPSLAYWAGGNEFENYILPTAKRSDPASYPQVIRDYEALFLSILFPAVFENTNSISYLPSSTSNGFISMNFSTPPYMEMRYADLVDRDNGSVYGVTDYYNYDSAFAFNTSSYPIGRFSNEFGYHSMPSARTWAQAILPDSMHFNSTTVVLRNRHYPPGGLDTADSSNSTMGMMEMTVAAQRWYPTPRHLDHPDNSHNGLNASENHEASLQSFAAWCWTTQVFQADFYASQIQFYKRGMGESRRTMGSLYWQLEDQWVAPTWAGIERGGRWKVLHYRAKDLYQEVVISPFWDAGTGILEVWASNELWGPVQGTVDLEWLKYSGEAVPGTEGLVTLRDEPLVVGPLNSTKVYERNVTRDIEAFGLEPRELVVRLRLNVTGPALGPLEKGGETRRRRRRRRRRTYTHSNWWHPTPLSEAWLEDPGLEWEWVDDIQADRASDRTGEQEQRRKSIRVRATKGVSAWTWVDLDVEGDHQASDNGFWLAKGESRAVQVVPFGTPKDESGVSPEGGHGDVDVDVRAVRVWSLWDNVADGTGAYTGAYKSEYLTRQV